MSARRLAAAGMVWLALASCGKTVKRPEHPNVVLVTLDTTRTDRLGAYGADPSASPALDALARSGVVFDRAWSVTPLTTPAHASVMTGLYPPAHGVRNNGRFRVAEDAHTLAEAFAAAGYTTAAFVGAFPVSRPFGMAQGFATFDDDFGTDERGRMRSERRASEVNARALPWLQAAMRGGAPFFMWIHYYDAHDPYEPPEPYASTFRDRPYDGEIASADAQLGALLASLKDGGAASTTVVLVAGDHGEALGDHGEHTHGLLLYEPTLHVPFVVRAPWAVAAGTRREDVASLVDIAPTLSALAGVPLPGELDGVSLLGPEAPDPERVVFAESLFAAEEFHWAPLAAVRRADAKWIAAPRPERYDLASDPREASNTAGRDAAGDRILRSLLESTAAASTRRRSGDARSPLDDETQARLQALGYVASGGTGRDAAAPATPGRDPKDAIADFEAYVQGTDALNAGADAVPVFERLVSADPGNPEFHLRLGQAYRGRGDLKRAEAVYRELVRQYPDFYLAYRRLAALLALQGRDAECRDLWLALRARDAGFVGVDARLAESFLATGETARALEAADAGLQKFPGDAELLVLAGRARERGGDDTGALASYRKALDAKPSDTEALDSAVALLKRLGRRDQAAALVDECIRRSAGDPAVSARRAAI